MQLWCNYYHLGIIQLLCIMVSAAAAKLKMNRHLPACDCDRYNPDRTITVNSYKFHLKEKQISNNNLVYFIFNL